MAKPSEKEIHVWVFSVIKKGAEDHSLLHLLSNDERLRAERFVRKSDRDAYVSAHGILRQILARYLKAEACELRFLVNPYGKPFLNPADFVFPLSFNLAHSGSIAVVAVACANHVGVDVERMREDIDVLEMANGHFSEAEAHAIRALSPEARMEAFFRCWTRKEAYLKACGEGFHLPPEQFSVSLDVKTPAVLWAADDPNVMVKWSMADLSPGEGYVGALVWQSGPTEILTRPWPE